MAKMKGSTKAILFLIVAYLGIGLYYHFTQNADGSLVTDLLTGGFNQLRTWFNF